jgi:hypothetical protein
VSAGLSTKRDKTRNSKALRGIKLSAPAQRVEEPGAGVSADAVERYRAVHKIPRAGGTTARAMQFPTYGLCPGYVAIRRWKKAQVEHDTLDDLARLGVNVEDLKASMGVIDE